MPGMQHFPNFEENIMKIATHLASLACLAALASLAAQQANAHYIWIERDAKSAKLYFGEVNEVREKSPGRMDSIKAPTAWAGKTDTALTVTRTPAHFDLTAAAGAAKASNAPNASNAGLGPQLLATEAGYGVQDWTRQGIGIVKPMFYARHSAFPVAATPDAQHRLDIVPVGGSRDRFQVTLGGKPLAKAKVNLYAPNDWSQDHRTGEDGTVKLPLPWRGQYVLEVIQKEDSAGEFDGKKFDAFRHRAILTIVKRDGLSFKGTGGGASWNAPVTANAAYPVAPNPATTPAAPAKMGQ